MYTKNIFLAARMVFSFISYGDFTYEITVHAVDCSERIRAARLDFSFII